MCLARALLKQSKVLVMDEGKLDCPKIQLTVSHFVGRLRVSLASALRVCCSSESESVRC